MLFLILRDAIVLFLLIYALLDLAHHFLRFLSHMLTETEPKVEGTYILNIDNIPIERTENIIRSAMMQGKTLLLLTSAVESETVSIAKQISRKFPYVHIVTREEFGDWLKSGTTIPSFVTHDTKANPNPSK
ncbi:MAG: hypothetical protein E7393_03945 [Ruminococcaceae bacterium]|nr:hypothetical protein [Oscillospiraceae bacterium]